MKRKLPLLLLLLLLVSVPAAASPPAKEFIFADITGRVYVSTDFRGSALLLFMGSTD
jgi:hypothetical protein